MDIDMSNGYLYFVFYDRRNYNNEPTDVYLAISKDGGNTFENYKISESPFLPSSSIFFGDYTNISVRNGIVRPIWTRLHMGQLSIWTAIINPNTPLRKDQSPMLDNSISAKVYPNPTNKENYFSFKLHSKSKISLRVVDIQGKLICEIINEQYYEPGMYIETFDKQNYSLKPGQYFFVLTNNNNRIIKEFIINR